MMNHCPEDYKTIHVFHCLSCLPLHSEVIWRQMQTKKKKKLEEPTAGAAQQPRVLEQFV